MKVAIVFYEIQNYGGILNSSNNLGMGFKALGHTVHPIVLKTKGNSGEKKATSLKTDPLWQAADGLPGCCIHQELGITGIRTINILDDMGAWFNFANSMDIVLFTVPIITLNSRTRGMGSSWQHVYSGIDPLVRQFAFIRDGNLRKLYPHISYVSNELDGLIGIHDNGYNSASYIDAPRVLIPNGHDIPKDFDWTPIAKREPILSAVQVFKRWKRVDDLVRAVPHMHGCQVVIGGRGIEYYYMTSEKKTKEEYIGIWDNAIACGMEYEGVMTTTQRDTLFSESRLMYDPSWALAYKDNGSHFNRTMIEAMIQGAVPVCTDVAMQDSILFEDGTNYLEVPYDMKPEDRGKLLTEYMLSDVDYLQEIADNNLEILEDFRNINVCKRLLAFMDDPDAYATGKFEKPDQKFLDAAKKNYDAFNA